MGIGRAFWVLSRKLRGRGSAIAAPLAMASVIAVWATLAAVASALLYLPHLPGGFVYGDGVPQRGDLPIAAGLARQYLTPESALPGAIFSVWHNVSGVVLAAYWRRRSPPAERDGEQVPAAVTE